MAKRFKEAADAAQPVYSTIIGSAQAEQMHQNDVSAKQRSGNAAKIAKEHGVGEQSAQVVQDAQEALKTQGKKGMKMPRINMAFSPSNIDFVRVMAAIKGQTMTQYVNALLDREREANGEAYEAAKKLSTDL